MQYIAVLLAVVLGASAAQAVVLSPDDVITASSGLVMRVDPVTGDRTTVSCTGIQCGGVIVGFGEGAIVGISIGAWLQMQRGRSSQAELRA